MLRLEKSLAQHLRTSLSVSAGFTIIEVMLVLAISGVIFAAAMSLFSGQAGETQFSASMQDLNSEITGKLKEVSTNLSGAYQQYTCTVAGNPPRAALSSGGTQSNNDCLYLGKAIFTPAGSSDIYIYTIIGNRLIYQNNDPNNPTGTAANFNDTNPVSAISPINLTEKYTMRSAKVLSSAINGSSDKSKYYLLGYYTDLQGSGGSPDSNPHLLAKGYDINTGQSYPYDTIVNDCITHVASACANTLDASVWSLCLADTGGNRTAKLDITNSPSGITTNLQINVQCS